MLAVLVLAGLPGLSYSLPVGAAIAFLMLAAGISYRQTIRLSTVALKRWIPRVFRMKANSDRGGSLLVACTYSLLP
jgi:hypothetical protein